MKHISLITAILAISSLVNGQAFGTVKTDSESTQGFLYTKTAGEKAIEGSPNFNDEWLQGFIISEDGVKADFKKMQFNIYLNKIIYLVNDILYTLPPTLHIDQFQIEESEFQLLSHNGSDQYFQVLQSGEKISLLKKFDCTLVKGRPSTGIMPAINNKFNITSDYFYVKNQGANIKKLKIKKNNVLEVMDSHSEKIDKYVAGNNLKFKKESNLIEVFEYYNTL